METAMRPPLPLLLLLLLPLLALASADRPLTSSRRDTSTGNRRYITTVCDIPCCKTVPNCVQATSVTCDCRNTNQMTLQSGFFPDTVQNVTISRVQNITIADGAIARLHQLEQLIIERSGTVYVQRHGLEQKENNRLRRFKIFGASFVTIAESAFTGQWNSDTRVFISNVDRMTVGKHGFSFSSDSSGPDLGFLRVKLLGLSPAAIAAPISTLFMLNVHMDVCHEDSFSGGDVSRMLLTNSNITEAKTGCVKDVKSLNIISTSFTTIQKGAFSGKFTYVRITNSTMTSVQTGGFHIEVENLHVNNTFIDALESRGLAVQATGSIFLNQVTVRVMKQYALFGLTRVSSTASWPAIRIHGLHITQQAYDGSLAFAADAPVELADLTVAPRKPRVCPTELWTRQLTGGTQDGQLTPNQRKVYEQLARSQPCVDENQPRTEDPDSRDDTDRTSPPARQPGTQATPRDDTQPRTEDIDNRDDTDRTPPPVDATDVPGEEHAVPPPGPAARGGTVTGPVLYSVLGAAGALAVAVAACLLVRRHRRRTAVTAGVRGGKQQPPAARVCPQQVSTESADQPTQRQLPDVCDYAEPLAVLQGDGDYAELPTAPPAGDYAEPMAVRQGNGGYAEPLAARQGNGDYAEPLAARQGNRDYAEPLAVRQTEGDYAEIPAAYDYAEPVSATAGRESECGDYAEVLVLHRRPEGPAGARTSLYATVQPSPAEADAPAKRRLSGSEEVPPLPPVTAERLQTPADVTDNLTDNVLYAPGNMTDNALYAETK